jgi:hypothetical protein
MEIQELADQYIALVDEIDRPSDINEEHYLKFI